jgi:hypothetical protein
MDDYFIIEKASRMVSIYHFNFFFCWKLWIDTFAVSESVVSGITNNLVSILYSDSISPMFLTNHCISKTFAASTKQNPSDYCT